MELTREQVEAKAAFLQGENDKLRAALLDAQVRLGAIRLDDPAPDDGGGRDA